MTATPHRAAPLRFLLGVAIIWTLGRGTILMGWRPPALRPPVLAGRAATVVGMPDPAWRAILPPPSPRARDTRLVLLARRVVTPVLLRRAGGKSGAERQTSARSVGETAQDHGRAAGPLILATHDSGNGLPSYHRSTGTVEAAIAHSAAQSTAHGRLSGSAWAFARGGGRASPLSPGGQIGGGQIGGGQTGVRLLYRLDRSGRLSASARLSTTIGGTRQSEAAAGFDWKPIASLPVHLTVERRFAIDRGGRNAWTAGIAGGVYDVRIAPGWRLDGYGEAGVVGTRRRDLYADGAARIARAIDLGGGRSLALGGGVWGATQPGAARLDVGPSAVLRLPVDHRIIAVALDWRQRIAGEARPGSGVALTVATDF